jgi:hypothetical protein
LLLQADFAQMAALDGDVEPLSHNGKKVEVCQTAHFTPSDCF